LNALVVPRLGSLGDTGDPFEPYRLLDGAGRVVGPVAAYLRDLQARGLPETTQRSYGLALLRWFRFLGAVGVSWEQATRVEARDFCRWIGVADKPVLPHWRHRGDPVAESAPGRATGVSANPVTGKTPPGTRYRSATAAHSETVLRGFYQFHLDRTRRGIHCTGKAELRGRWRWVGRVGGQSHEPVTVRPQHHAVHDGTVPGSAPPSSNRPCRAAADHMRLMWQDTGITEP